MEIRIFKTAEEIASCAADEFEKTISSKPDCVLGLATGATPLDTYKELIARYRAGKIDFSKVSSFNLDEYCDLPVTDENSYRYFMDKNLFDHINIRHGSTHVPDGNAEDTDAECAAYDKAIEEAGGIDIQLLGIGRNAHIGFNEPSDKFTEGTHKIELTESTIEANKIYFTESPMPHYAITMGVGSIMKAKKIILIAIGDKKTDAVYDTVKGPVTPSVPASALQEHPDVLIICDEAAAARL